jgi:hypothetical protein
MKNTFACLLIMILLISSCSSVKENLSPINTYLKSKLEKNELVIIIENKINNNYTIDTFTERATRPINPNTIENSIVLKPLLYEEKYRSQMNEKYRNQNTDEIWLKNRLWSQNDFIDIKIKFVKEDVFPKPYVYNEYMKDKMDEAIVFSFSEPIFYKNKKYVLFAKAETTSKKQFINPNSIVVMKKKSGKWIIIQEIISGDYY